LWLLIMLFKFLQQL